jgi:hypothetical protein
MTHLEQGSKRLKNQIQHNALKLGWQDIIQCNILYTIEMLQAIYANSSHVLYLQSITVAL